MQIMSEKAYMLTDNLHTIQNIHAAYSGLSKIVRNTVRHYCLCVFAMYLMVVQSRPQQQKMVIGI